MNISLTPELEQFVISKVESGFYHSASEVIREGLRILAEQDEIKKKRLKMLDLEISKGLTSLQTGDILSGEEVYHQLKERHKTYKAT